MRKLCAIMFLILFIFFNANSQQIKSAFKTLKKGDHKYARSLFNGIYPKSSASEYGKSFIYFNDYLADLKSNQQSHSNTTILLNAFIYIQNADSLLPFKDEKILKKIKDQYSDKRVIELKNRIYDSILNLDNKNFNYIYSMLKQGYMKVFSRNKSFYAKVTDLYIQNEFELVKADIKKGYKKYKWKLNSFIRDNNNWKNIAEAIALKDSLFLTELNTNQKRYTYLRLNKNSKHYNKIKSDYIKNLKEEKINAFVIKSSNNADEFVDSIVKNKKLYKLCVRSKENIENSTIKDKYFLCLQEKAKSIYYFNLDKLEEYKKQYPNMFTSTVLPSGYCIMYSKDKVYRNGKLTPQDYEVIIVLKPEWLKQNNRNWGSNFVSKIRAIDIICEIKYVSTDFENVKVRRKTSPFYSNLDISKFAKKCPNGGVLFLKSRKNAYLVKCPACSMIDKVVESAVKYFKK